MRKLAGRGLGPVQLVFFVLGRGGFVLTSRLGRGWSFHGHWLIFLLQGRDLLKPSRPRAEIG